MRSYGVIIIVNNTARSNYTRLVVYKVFATNVKQKICSAERLPQRAITQRYNISISRGGFLRILLYTCALDTSPSRCWSVYASKRGEDKKKNRTDRDAVAIKVIANDVIGKTAEIIEQIPVYTYICWVHVSQNRSTRSRTHNTVRDVYL